MVYTYLSPVCYKYIFLVAALMLVSLACYPDPISWVVFLVQSPGSYYLVCVPHVTTLPPLLNGASSSLELWPTLLGPPLIR